MKQDKNSILSLTNADSFKNVVADALALAKASGATQAEAGLSVSQGLSVATRMGSVETIEHQQDNGLGIERRSKRPAISRATPPRIRARVSPTPS